MHYFRAAQPALLYLSPACIVAVTLTAIVRGESTKLWRYIEEEDKQEETVQEEDTSGAREGADTPGKSSEARTEVEIDGIRRRTRAQE